jgi:hypothetical protein
VLFVESAPGQFHDYYDFESERRRIAAAVQAQREILPGRKPERVAPVHFLPTSGLDERKRRCDIRFALTETVSALRKTARQEKWQVIHVSGVDTHQAASLVADYYEHLTSMPAEWAPVSNRRWVKDGMILESTSANSPTLRNSLRYWLTKAMNLATLNLYYLARRRG